MCMYLVVALHCLKWWPRHSFLSSYFQKTVTWWKIMPKIKRFKQHFLLDETKHLFKTILDAFYVLAHFVLVQWWPQDTECSTCCDGWWLLYLKLTLCLCAVWPVAYALGLLYTTYLRDIIRTTKRDLELQIEGESKIEGGTRLKHKTAYKYFWNKYVNILTLLHN